MKCLPQTVVKPIALAMDDAQNFRQPRRLVTRQMYNVVTGMMDGDSSQPLHSMQDDNTTAEDKTETDELTPAAEAWSTAEKAYWAAAMAKGKGSKGKGGKSKGKGKGLAGYGECYNCGEWGHPARECPNLGKLHGGVPTAAAFKGGKGKGKTGKEKGKAGKGKGKYNYYNNNKRSLNYASEHDYNDTWGNQEAAQDWQGEHEWPGDTNSDNYNYGFWDSERSATNNYSPNYGMLLLKKPCVLTGSKYFQRDLLLNDGDSDDDEECEEREERHNSLCVAKCTVQSKQEDNKTKTKNRAKGGHTKLQHAMSTAISDSSKHNTMTTTSQCDDSNNDHTTGHDQTVSNYITTRQTTLNTMTNQPHDHTTRLTPHDSRTQSQHKRRVRFMNTMIRSCTCQDNEHDHHHDNYNYYNGSSSARDMRTGTHCNSSSKWSPNCVYSSNCSSCYVSPLRVWESDGEEARKVMSPREGSPLAKLLNMSMAHDQVPDHGSPAYTDGHEPSVGGERHDLVPRPSTCTCPRRLIVNAGDTGGVHSEPPQAQWRISGEAHTQRSRGQDGGAPPDPLRVAASTGEDRVTQAGPKGRAPEKDREDPSLQTGFRRPWFQNSTGPSESRVVRSEEDSQNASPQPGQLRVRSGQVSGTTYAAGTTTTSV